jgi:hypothetical protein
MNSWMLSMALTTRTISNGWVVVGHREESSAFEKSFKSLLDCNGLCLSLYVVIYVLLLGT